MALRFLVVEGNTRADRERHASIFGIPPADGYAQEIRRIAPDAVCEVAFPADEGANLPDSGGLEGYDAVVLTGSALNLYDMTPPILRQIALMRAVYASGTPSFGSCWGIQVAAAAAGGSVVRNPLGIEIGFARRIQRTQASAAHELLDGRPAVYDAPAIHRDIVETLPEGAVVLAQNAMAGVQAAELTHAGGRFWGVQYHPEFSLFELAAYLARYGERLVAAGLCADEAAAERYAGEIATLGRDPSRRDLAWAHGLDAEVLDPDRRTREIRNFVEALVRPTKSARGRA